MREREGRMQLAARRLAVAPMLAVAALALAVGCAGRSLELGDPDRFAPGECLARFTLRLDDSPRAQRAEHGGRDDALPASHPAAEIDPSQQRPVEAAAALGIDGRPLAWFAPDWELVVLDAAAFAPLRGVDATAVSSGSPQRVGRVTPRARTALGERGVVELLLRAEVIRSYQHLGADLCLHAETRDDAAYVARLHGVQHLVDRTTKEHPLAFAVRIDAEGVITVTTPSG